MNCRFGDRLPMILTQQPHQIYWAISNSLASVAAFSGVLVDLSEDLAEIPRESRAVTGCFLFGLYFNTLNFY